MKEKYCEKYFENTVKPKHLRDFEAKTPNGNIIKGYISRKPNKYLGSLIITHITEKNGNSYDTEQFVQAFPKIHYWDRRHQLKQDSQQLIYYCQEKLDGTCLIIYSLNDQNGNSIEIIPKSRLQAVADQRILDMYKLVDKKSIEDFFKNPAHFNDTLIFELYGILNRHDVAHMETYIDIRLIGAYISEEFLNYISITCFSDLDKFKKPDTIYTIEKYPQDNTFSVKWNDENQKLKNYKIISENDFPTLYDAIQEVKILLEKINIKYAEYNGRRVIEGIVINGVHFNGTQMYLKVKPRDIELEAKQPDSVPRRFVLKEVQKYFDEFGSNVRTLYENDDTHYIKYIKHNLKEEFSYEQIEDPRTYRRIKKVFMEVWDAQLPPVSIQNICEELIRQNPEDSIPELMKKFARNYPSKKNQSRYVYNILSKIQKRNE